MPLYDVDLSYAQGKLYVLSVTFLLDEGGSTDLEFLMTPAYHCNCLCVCETYFLTRCSRVLEKLTGLQLVKKFLAFYGTQTFITAVTSARRQSLS